MWQDPGFVQMIGGVIGAIRPVADPAPTPEVGALIYYLAKFLPKTA